MRASASGGEKLGTAMKGIKRMKGISAADSLHSFYSFHRSFLLYTSPVMG
jgi:hypothetical protein